MERLSSILPKVLKKRGLYTHAEASIVIIHAREWILRELPGIAPHLRPEVYKDGVLKIVAENPIALQEAHLASERLRTYLQQEAGHPGCREIALRRA